MAKLQRSLARNLSWVNTTILAFPTIATLCFLHIWIIHLDYSFENNNSVHNLDINAHWLKIFITSFNNPRILYWLLSKQMWISTVCLYLYHVVTSWWYAQSENKINCNNNKMLWTYSLLRRSLDITFNLALTWSAFKWKSGKFKSWMQTGSPIASIKN